MYFTYNNINIYYEIKGDPNGKETIVFLNGVMASTTSWDLTSPLFEKFGFKIIRFDFKGQLKSDKPVPENGIYSFKEHAEETKALLDFLGVKSVHLVGTSYGGEVSMKFASMYPSFVKTLTIIDSVSELDDVCKGFVNSWKALCDLNDGEVFFKGMAPSIYGPDFLKNNRKMLEDRAKAFKSTPREYYEGQKILYDTFAQDVTMTSELSKIECPTLVVCGQEDILKPQKFSEIIYQNIKKCEFAVFPHCGHVTIFEQPGILNSTLLGFILKNCK